MRRLLAHFAMVLGMAIGVFLLASGLSYLLRSDGYGIIPVNDGIKQIGFPFLVYEEGGFAHRENFYPMALLGNLAVSIVTGFILHGLGRVAPMKGLGIPLLATAVAVWLLISLVRDFFDSIQYFAAEPGRLLYVVGLAIAGGVGTVAFARLSRTAQRRVRLFAWSAAASALTLCLSYMALRWASLFSLVIDSGAIVGVLLVFLLVAAIAAYLWLEFYREWKRGVVQ